MHVTALIVAGGSGKRFKVKSTKKLKKKQYILLNNKPIIYHSIYIFEKHPMVDSIVVVIKKGDKNEYKKTCNSFSKIYKIVNGGRFRQDSVFNGINDVPSQTSIILIHDAVRPFVTKEMVTKLILSAKRNKTAVPAVSVKDTIRKNNKTINRKNMFLVQTPQAFSFKLLWKAYKKAYEDRFYGSDDSSLVERMGCRLKIVKGSAFNIKITTYEDYLLAKAIYKIKFNRRKN